VWLEEDVGAVLVDDIVVLRRAGNDESCHCHGHGRLSRVFSSARPPLAGGHLANNDLWLPEPPGKHERGTNEAKEYRAGAPPGQRRAGEESAGRIGQQGQAAPPVG